MVQFHSSGDAADCSTIASVSGIVLKWSAVLGPIAKWVMHNFESIQCRLETLDILSQFQAMLSLNL